MTPDGLRAQYLIPNLSLSAIAYPSICPFRSGHVITQSRKISANSSSAERKQIADRELFCRIFPKKPSFFRTDFLPSWAHKSDSFLYQILVLTVWKTGQAGFDLDSREEHTPREKLKPSTNRSPDSFHGSK
jgi:hypothetical protein